MEISNTPMTMTVHFFLVCTNVTFFLVASGINGNGNGNNNIFEQMEMRMGIETLMEDLMDQQRKWQHWRCTWKWKRK